MIRVVSDFKMFFLIFACYSLTNNYSKGLVVYSGKMVACSKLKVSESVYSHI